MRSRQLDRAFFLGRRVEIFVRQRADGSILEMALRNPSGYRAFDDAALAAVEKALGGVAPGTARDGEVRTLWQLDATAYVVISPNPELSSISRPASANGATRCRTCRPPQFASSPSTDERRSDG